MKFLVPLVCLVAAVYGTAEVDPNLPLSYGLTPAVKQTVYTRKVPVLASRVVPAKETGYFIQQYHTRYLSQPHRYSYVTFPRYHPGLHTYYGFPYQHYYGRYDPSVPVYQGYHPLVSSSYVHHYETVPQVGLRHEVPVYEVLVRPTVQPVVQPEVQPVVQPAVAPVPDQTPLLEPAPEHVQEPHPEVVQRPGSQPAYTPAPETVPEVASEPAPEPDVVHPEPDVPRPPRRPVQDAYARPEPVAPQDSKNEVPVTEPVRPNLDEAEPEYPNIRY
ncbi:keratinocyte proline-rich protein-like [Ornithodoros turicata]|uniref:keratinocyte proline-rich protein-like n=1 Tax=Ornithodoros turicata TaxID=34597 RepID=UPI003138771E